jgi:hypothetical protein
VNTPGRQPSRGRRVRLPAYFLCLAALAPIASPAPVSLAAVARAQNPPTFDPSRDLEGYDACFASPFRDLYPFDSYTELLGKEITSTALADVQKRWKADRDAAEAKLAALRADPPEQTLWLLRHRLARSAYFSKITWTEDRSVPGIVFLVQRPARDVPDYAKNIARDCGPWLQKVQTLFDEQYAKPLKLERPPTRAIWPIAILASEGDYRNFLRIHWNFGADVGFACYDLKLGLTVGYVDPFKVGVSVIDKRYPMMNALVRGMLDGYATAPEGRPGALWIEEGLASYLAYHEGAAPDCLDARRLRPSMLRSVLVLAQDKKAGPILFHRIEDLVSMRSTEDIDKRSLALSEAAKIPPPPERDVLDAFYGESTLWMHFLHRGMDGALREPLLKYLRWSLAGEAGASVLKLAFEGKDLAAIDSAFLAWVADEMRRELPQASVDGAAIGALFSDAAGISKASPAVAEAAPAHPYSPAGLAVDATDAESRHGLALLQARAGDLEGAVAALKSIPDAAVDAADKPRIARDVARIGQLISLRDGFLENLRQSGAKWSTDVQGKKLVASIAKVEGGFVHLAENRQGIQKLPLASLDPMEIAKQATKREQQGNSEPWARFYAYVLAEDGKWEKLLKDPSDEAKSLREDARAWIPARLRAGRAAAALNALAQTPVPGGSRDGEAACASIRALLAEFRDVPIVQRKMGELRLLARSAAAAAFADVEPASLLHAKWSPIGDGRVDIAYEFDSRAEEQDFVKHPGYLKSWHKALGIEAGKEEAAAWTVQDGKLTGVGAACYRLPLAFTSPMTVRYELRVLEGGGEGRQQANFAVGICDDRKEDNILSVDFGGLSVRDNPKGVHTDLVPAEGYSYAPGTSYSFEVRHDGANVSVWVDGEKTNEAACATRAGGEFFLWFHTTLPISIERLEIQAKVDPASAQSLRNSCAEKRLSELGFP